MTPIDKQLYYIDIEAIEQYIFKKHEGEEPVECETVYGPKGTMISTTTLAKGNDERYTQIRYDMIKTMLDATYNSGVESEEGNISYVQEMENNSIGAKLIFNTLLVNGFIKNKLD